MTKVGGIAIEHTDTQSGPPSALLAAVLVASFALIWAVVEKIASLANVSVEQLVWTRYGTHLLVLVLLFGRRHPASLVRTKRPLVQIGRSLLMLGMPLSFVAATHSMLMEDVLAVFWITLLVIQVIRWRYSDLVRIAAGVAGYCGVFVILRATPGILSLGSVFALGMGACLLAYLWLTEVLSADSTATNLFHSALWVFLILSFRMPFVWKKPSFAAWIAMAMVGILGLLALYTLDHAIRIEGWAAFTPTLYLQPVFTILFGEHIGFRMAVGTAVIVIAIIVAVSAAILNTDLTRRSSCTFIAKG